MIACAGDISGHYQDRELSNQTWHDSAYRLGTVLGGSPAEQDKGCEYHIVVRALPVLVIQHLICKLFLVLHMQSVLIIDC